MIIFVYDRRDIGIWVDDSLAEVPGLSGHDTPGKIFLLPSYFQLQKNDYGLNRAAVGKSFLPVP